MTVIFELVLGTTLIVLVIYLIKLVNIQVVDQRSGLKLYRNTANAYRTGVVMKKAKENGVDLVYPDDFLEDDEFVKKIDEEVEADLNKTD